MGYTKEFTQDEELKLRKLLKRCSLRTSDAACAFRRTGDTEHLTTVVEGIIVPFSRYDRRVLHAMNRDQLRLTEDLSFDSLTVFEILFLAEEALEVSIDNEELRGVGTIGDIKRLIVAKAKSAQVPATYHEASSVMLRESSL